MKKLLITESQLNNLRINLKEDIQDRKYNKSVGVSVNIDINSLKYRGKEITDFTAAEGIRLHYNIDIHSNESGIEFIDLNGVVGPNSIKFHVQYDDGEIKKDLIEIPAKWEILDIDKDKNHGEITLDDTLDVWIDVDKQGELYISDMSITQYTF